jgi:hypothetical protein
MRRLIRGFKNGETMVRSPAGTTDINTRRLLKIMPGNDDPAGIE